MFSPALVKKVCTYVYNIILKTLIFNRTEKKKDKQNKSEKKNSNASAYAVNVSVKYDKNTNKK